MLPSGRQGSADRVKLCEHPDFDQVIIRTSEHFASEGLRPSMIEKDYYVTEALRIIASTAGPQVIFKGGTSLSKGWDLIKRFSEDIDIFLDPLAFDPHLRSRGIDRELKVLRDAVNQHPALTFLPDESRTIGGFGRNDYFSYNQLFGGVGEIANRVLLEAGTTSGRAPTTNIDLSSYVARFLQESGSDLDVEDVGSFCMRLLHFRRTFVEKMFAIHSRVELLKRDNQAPGPWMRHYYDIFQLSHQEEVLAMLQSEEYAQIKNDYGQISRAHFSRTYTPPLNMSFANSDALFPPEALSAVLSEEYAKQCRALCYGPFPRWPELLSRLAEIRALL